MATSKTATSKTATAKTAKARKATSKKVEVDSPVQTNAANPDSASDLKVLPTNDGGRLPLKSGDQRQC